MEKGKERQKIIGGVRLVRIVLILFTPPANNSPKF